MERLRDSTLVEMAKSKRAYPHEVKAVVEELQMLREIYNGKRPAEDYSVGNFHTIKVPMALITGDMVTSAARSLEKPVGVPSLVEWSAYPGRRYVVCRIK